MTVVNYFYEWAKLLTKFCILMMALYFDAWHDYTLAAAVCSILAFLIWIKYLVIIWSEREYSREETANAKPDRCSKFCEKITDEDNIDKWEDVVPDDEYDSEVDCTHHSEIVLDEICAKVLEMTKQYELDDQNGYGEQDHFENIIGYDEYFYVKAHFGLEYMIRKDGLENILRYDKDHRHHKDENSSEHEELEFLTEFDEYNKYDKYMNGQNDKILDMVRKEFFCDVFTHHGSNEFQPIYEYDDFKNEFENDVGFEKHDELESDIELEHLIGDEYGCKKRNTKRNQRFKRLRRALRITAASLRRLICGAE